VALKARQDELEGFLVAAPAEDWPEAVERARYLLGLFCWALIALVILSAANRLLTLREALRNDPHNSWIKAIPAALLLVLPVVALCGAAIFTLTDDAVWRAFASR